MTSKIKVDNIADQNDNNIINESGDVITVGAAGDTVAVAGNIVKSNALQASDGGNIVSQSGTTITLGASGDTINLASGASQSGFGRSGSVNWQTGSIKTATFTAASGEGYFCNTSGGAFTVNLPAGSAGAIVAISDYTRTFNSNNLTISPNGSEKIGGVVSDLTLSVNGQALTLVYVDGTEGWINVQNAEDTETGVYRFICASGGTETTSGDFKIHTFTGPGTFTVNGVSACTPARNIVSYLAVAGGGGGGICGGGGGGAGGFREGKNAPICSYTVSPLNAPAGIPVSVQGYPITVGAAGAGASGPSNNGDSGSVSTFSSITSAGGGGGGSFGGGASLEPGKQALTGGSGGGAGGIGPSSTISGAAGNTPPVSPPQGNAGGSGQHIGGCTMKSGGGGGATGAGDNGANQTPGPGSSRGGTGGAGAATHITGAPLAYSGGGGGAGFGPSGSAAGSPCGTGGTGGANSSSATVAGTTNRGGGGGGGAHSGGGPNGGSNGGSGVVIIRYKFQ